MIATFAATSIAFATIVAISMVRRHGIHCVTAWFLLTSIVFINLAFLGHFVSSDGPKSLGTETGTVATSVGLLTATIVGWITHLARGRPRLERARTGHTWVGTENQTAVIELGLDERNSLRQLAIASVVILSPSWMYFVLLGEVPLLTGVTAILREGTTGLGTLQTSRLARDPYATATASYIPLQGAWEVFRNFGSPLIFGFAYAQLKAGLVRRPRVLAMLAAILTSMAAGQRWPLMIVGMTWLMVSGRMSSRADMRRVVKGLTALAFAGVALSAMQARTTATLSGFWETLWFGAANLFFRIFAAQAQIPIASYEPWHDKIHNLGGLSYAMSLRSYLPGPGASFPVAFYQAVTGDSRGHTAPPDFYTEAYLNFGMAGVIICTAAWLSLITVIDLKPTAHTPAKLAAKSTVAAVIAFSSFSGAIFTIGVLLPVISFSTSIWLINQTERHRQPPTVTPRLGR